MFLMIFGRNVHAAWFTRLASKHLCPAQNNANGTVGVSVGMESSGGLRERVGPYSRRSARNDCPGGRRRSRSLATNTIGLDPWTCLTVSASATRAQPSRGPSRCSSGRIFVSWPLLRSGKDPRWRWTVGRRPVWHMRTRTRWFCGRRSALATASGAAPALVWTARDRDLPCTGSL